MLSKVIPSSFGLDVVGIVVPLTLIGSGLLTSLENVVKVVAVDFPGDSWRCLFLSHSARVVRYPFIRLQSGGVVGPDVSSDMSSAYEIISGNQDDLIHSSYLSLPSLGPAYLQPRSYCVPWYTCNSYILH